MSFDYEFHQEWLDEIHVNEAAVLFSAAKYEKALNKAWRKLESLLLLKAITLVDLTTLAGDDTYSNVSALVNKALHPLSADFLSKILDSVSLFLVKINSTSLKEKRNVKLKFDKINDLEYVPRITGNIDDKYDEFKDLSFAEFQELKRLVYSLGLHDGDTLENLAKFLSLKNNITVPGFPKNSEKVVRTAAICVYPALVKEVKNILVTKGLNTDSNDSNEIIDTIPIAAVAAGFPSGLYDLTSKIHEINFAIRSGATEIDIVISRYLVLGNRWLELFNEIRALKQACGKVHMKTILSVGECGSLENVYKTSMVAMMAGSDYIKTSTGKESVNATFPTGLVMCRAVNNFYVKTGKKIGFKPAGGIRTADDSLKWLRLVISELGAEWLPLFRMGASGVLGDIIKRLQKLNS